MTSSIIIVAANIKAVGHHHSSTVKITNQYHRDNIRRTTLSTIPITGRMEEEGLHLWQTPASLEQPILPSRPQSLVDRFRCKVEKTWPELKKRVKLYQMKQWRKRKNVHREAIFRWLLHLNHMFLPTRAHRLWGVCAYQNSPLLI